MTSNSSTARIGQICSKLSEHELPGSSTLQEILEKFEFFPIKCRIQRAMEVFEISQKGSGQRGQPGDKQLKTKV